MSHYSGNTLFKLDGMTGGNNKKVEKGDNKVMRKYIHQPPLDDPRRGSLNLLANRCITTTVIRSFFVGPRPDLLITESQHQAGTGIF
jgi:hypothetical protein